MAKVEIEGLSGIQKNTDGHLGPKCNTCGGFGYTLTFAGSAGCRDCNQTGVSMPTIAALEERIGRLEYEIQALKDIVIRAVNRSAQ